MNDDWSEAGIAVSGLFPFLIGILYISVRINYHQNFGKYIMSTKPPSAVKESAADSLEKTAYNSVHAITTEEPNDRNRLGYHVWRWLLTKQGTLEEAVTESGARLHISHLEAVKIIREALTKQGVTA